jgi:hypothetical protein
MKTLICITAALLLFGLLNFSHGANQIVTQECENTRQLRVIIGERRDGYASGISDKLNSRLGDNVSVGLLKLYSEEDLKKKENIELYLPIVRAAFPAAGTQDQACKCSPKVTMFLLRWLSKETIDSSLNREIEKTINYVQEQSLNTCVR